MHSNNNCQVLTRECPVIAPLIETDWVLFDDFSHFMPGKKNRKCHELVMRLCIFDTARSKGTQSENPVGTYGTVCFFTRNRAVVPRTSPIDPFKQKALYVSPKPSRCLHNEPPHPPLPKIQTGFSPSSLFPLASALSLTSRDCREMFADLRGLSCYPETSRITQLRRRKEG